MKLFEKKKPALATGENEVLKKKEKPISPKEAAHDFINASKEFEKSRVETIENSKKVAWIVAAVSVAITALLAVAIMVMMPLKKTEPYLVRVDNNTGSTDIVTVLAGTNGITDTEATSRYFAAMYVRLMEGYDWFTVQDNVNTLMLFSDANMQNRINNKYSAPDAPHKLYADKSRVEIQINSISKLNESGLLQIRFTKKIVPINGGIYDKRTDTYSPALSEEKRIITMGFEYVNVPKLDEIRLKNPLGFTVKSYQNDKDGI